MPLTAACLFPGSVASGFRVVADAATVTQLPQRQRQLPVPTFVTREGCESSDMVSCFHSGAGVGWGSCYPSKSPT